MAVTTLRYFPLGWREPRQGWLCLDQLDVVI